MLAAMANNVLIVKLSSLGDVIHTLPAAQAIRAALPGARLAWAIDQAHAALVRCQPWIDEVIEWNRQARGGFVDFVGHLRRTRWDVAVDFQGLFRSGLVARLSRAKRRIGFVPSRELAHWFYNDGVPWTACERHAVERNLELAVHLGADVSDLPMHRPYLDGPPPDEVRPAGSLFPLPPTTQDLADVVRWCAAHGFDPARQQLVILNPHCRREANCWPASHFTQLAERLLTLPNVRIALSGGPVARSLCEQIAAPLGASIWRADGQLSILGTAALFKRASVVVTGDTGPMHIAAAVGAPQIALLGATSPRRTGPYAANAVVLRAGLECSPCLSRRCPLRHDPPLCMVRIGVDQVFDAVLARLGQVEGAPHVRKSA